MMFCTDYVLGRLFGAVLAWTSYIQELNCWKNKDYEGRQFDSIKKGIAWSLGSAATKILHRTCLQGHAIRREIFSQFYINFWKNIAAFLLAKTRWQLNNGTCWYWSRPAFFSVLRHRINTIFLQVKQKFNSKEANTVNWKVSTFTLVSLMPW